MDEMVPGEELRLEVDELRASRTRLVAEADDRRRTVERALHDGVQQYLVAVAVNLQLARELADSDPTALKSFLEEIATDVREALESVRALARDVYPSLLLDRGLRDALRDAAGEAPLNARLDAPPTVPRYSAEVEATVYFCCVAALAALARADASGTATVGLHPDDRSLAFEVSAEVGDALDARAALTEIDDRLGAMNGQLEVSTTDGTMRIAGAIPLGR